MKRYAIATSLALIMLSSSPTTHRAGIPDEPVSIKAIPPTFITLNHIPECMPSAPFPQTNPLPYFKDAEHIQFSCSYYDKDHVAWAMYIFYELWEREFGDTSGKLAAALDNITIVWGEDVKTVQNVYDIDGNFLESATVSGLMMDDSTIWIWVDGENMSDSSLVHELTHIALRHNCGDADADHEGIKYLCWDSRHSDFIDNVNTVLRETYGL